jgi:hypothetical protein
MQVRLRSVRDRRHLVAVVRESSPVPAVVAGTDGSPCRPIDPHPAGRAPLMVHSGTGAWHGLLWFVRGSDRGRISEPAPGKRVKAASPEDAASCARGLMAEQAHAPQSETRIEKAVEA